jgi:hypothetical protein
MLERVRSLTQFIRDKKKRGEKFVVMLGAGASLSSGIKPTATIMEELVKAYPSSTAGGVEDRFDALWASSTKSARAAMIEPYLTAPPSEGFQRFAELIAFGYFDLVITFNFDRLLELSLNELGFNEYKTIIRGETDLDAIGSLVKSPKPRVKILKMHGSLDSADYFLFSKEEMLNYPPELEAIVNELTGRDIIICGYAFNDMCVMRAFNTSKEAGAIYFVNPAGAVGQIKGFLPARRSQDKVIDGDLGRFDTFAKELHTQLSAADEARSGRAARQDKENWFKFLDCYYEGQEAYFIGRRWLRSKLKKQITDGASPVLCVSGKANVGKTSLVRAGLMGDLRTAGVTPVYIRCRAGMDFDKALCTELARELSTSADGADTQALLSRLDALPSKRVVIILDQFERPCRAADDDDQARRALLAFINPLVDRAGERLGVVFVSVDEAPFWKLMVNASSPQKRATAEVRAFSRQAVSRIIRYAAARGRSPLDPSVIAALCDEYQKSVAGKADGHPFTLTHVQTICYYLARGSQQTWQGSGRLPASLAAALESLRDDASLLDVLDEVPSDERRLLRSFLKVICDPENNPRRIIGLIKTHFPEIREDRFPEPIA